MSGKKPRRSKSLTFGVLLILLAGIWCIFRLSSGGGSHISGATNEERVQYIESFGWSSAPVPSSIEEIRIPSRFDEAYTQYNALQKEQGFDLMKYRACYAKKYTYEISGSDGTDPVVPICANLLVIDGEIVGADVSSSEANGLVTVLAKK
ncbi:MAG: DUF4830 domain-containing protein [Lachnospiraceae bacterium]|nr:DUF4830 domain-containing protein [Ruminococcus sp.]MCM1274487.1 DUF4830 domain-containing protein [Lachnospiraceae bacterium]